MAWCAKDIDNLIFQCGDGARNSLDFSAATYNRNSDKPRLIDSFKLQGHLKILVMSYLLTHHLLCFL
jgi:hypothetical protein